MKGSVSVAKIIDFEALSDEELSLSAAHTYWAYNAADCLVTSEIAPVLEKQLDEHSGWIYYFERACLAPAMEMALRGIRVDMLAKEDFVRRLSADADRYEEILLEYGRALGHPAGINANSTTQLKKIFYDQLLLPEQRKYDRAKKEEKVSVDREALEKLQVHKIANPLVLAILGRRDCVKKLSVLRSGIDRDSRMRFSFNVGGTETGRWSSSKNAFGGGMNAQNLTEELRYLFISSSGKKLAYIDLEQAESRAVAYLSGDRGYWDACNSGDLHTTVTRLIWPNRGWTGNPADDRKLADAPFYRQYSYRDMAKRGGHGSNYLGTPRTMAKHLKIEPKIMEDFQYGYFKAFPGIKHWHEKTASQLQSKGKLITPFGRVRPFLSRLNDNATIREAVAYVPQSLIADYMNAGVCRLWDWGKVDLLAQIHDAVVFEYPEGQDALVAEAATILSAPITLINGDSFSIPCEPNVGWNWGKETKDNPLGLRKLKKGDDRKGPVVGENVAAEILGRAFK
jgi:DNA polymerase I-like protein with 3'-5' exonuclease and polymerase domains